MKSGILNLAPLIKFIRAHRDIPHKKDPVFGMFNEIYGPLVRHIPDISGWYVWMRVEADKKAIVYIGKSESRRTSSLRARIKEEMLDEYVALWASVWDPDEVVAALDQKYGGKYTSSIRRSARKAGATHVVWFGKEGISGPEIEAVEHSLIAKYAPLANKQLRKQAQSSVELFSEAESAFVTEMGRIIE